MYIHTLLFCDHPLMEKLSNQLFVSDEVLFLQLIILTALLTIVFARLKKLTSIYLRN
jgi:hypothetical protein